MKLRTPIGAQVRDVAVICYHRDVQGERRGQMYVLRVSDAKAEAGFHDLALPPYVALQVLVVRANANLAPGTEVCLRCCLLQACVLKRPCISLAVRRANSA